MTIKEFLTEISDEQGPMQGTAAYVIERMKRADFDALMLEIKKLSAETWEERERVARGNKKDD